MWRYHVFEHKLTCYFIGVYKSIIKSIFLSFFFIWPLWKRSGIIQLQFLSTAGWCVKWPALIYVKFYIAFYSLRSKRCRASSSRTSGREKKKGMTGEGEGKEGNACPQTPRFWKTAFAHERSFWLVQCWLCWLLSTRNINQSRYALFTCVTDLVSSDLWPQITKCFGLRLLKWKDSFCLLD